MTGRRSAAPHGGLPVGDLAPLPALVGPTAAGKSDLAVEAVLASGAPAEIVSCDSMAVYRGLDVSAAKPTAEQRRAVVHHLLDVAGAGERFTAVAYRRLAREAIADVAARGGLAFLVGGSGLYFRAAVDELEFAPHDPDVRARLEGDDPAELFARLSEADPAMAATVDPRNVRRVVRAVEILEITGRPPSQSRRLWEARTSAYDLRAIAVTRPREELVERARLRLQRMLEGGLVDEIAAAVDAGLSQTAAQGVGVKEFVAHVQGRASLEEATATYLRNVRRFIGRQLSWFRSDPRIDWIDLSEVAWDDAVGRVSSMLARSAPA